MMLIPLYYLLSQAYAEWVEIAQNNYRRNILRKDSVEFTTEVYRNYPNLTMRAPERHRGLVNKVNHVGHVRRVPFAEVTKPTLKIYPGEPPYRPTQETTLYTDTNTDGASNKQEYYDIDLGDLLKISKFDNTKSNIHNKPTGKLNALSSIDSNDEDVYSDRIDRISLTTKPSSIKNQSETGYSHRPNIYSISDSRVNFKDFNTEPSTSSMMVLNINEDKDKNDYKFQTKRIKTKHEPEQINRKNLSKIPKLSSSVENYANLNKPNEESLNSSTTDLNISKDLDADGESASTKPELLGASFDSQKPEVSKLGLETSEKDYFDGMWRMLTFIKDIITKNTQKSVKSKIKYLEDLKNNILYSIEDHINRAWPDDPTPRGPEHSRAARSAHARGHIELPSSEGALMTISFLTFAVFLIKLVLVCLQQIIHTYKNKTMMMTPAVLTAVGRAATGARTRN